MSTLPECTVDQIGHSQVMDAPGQEPSVTLLDWQTGKGTASYWTTWLLTRSFSLGQLCAGLQRSRAVGIWVKW